MSSKTYRYDAAACRTCVSKFMGKDQPIPCLRAYENSKARGTAQVDFYWASEIGRRCPAILRWAELYSIIMGKQGGWDANRLALSYTPGIKEKANPKHFDPGVDLTREWVGESCDYKWDEDSERFLYKLVSQSYAAIGFLPNDRFWQGFLDQVFYRQVMPDPATTWIGFAEKFGSGVGAGKSRSAGNDAVFGRICNWAKLMKGEQEWYGFDALLNRTKVYGADATVTVNIVYITGVKDPRKQLPGVRFSGADLNLALIGNLKTISKADEAAKLVKVAKAVLSKASAIDKANLETLVNWGRRAQCTYEASQGSGISVAFIDAALGSGLALSWAEWEGSFIKII